MPLELILVELLILALIGWFYARWRARCHRQASCAHINHTFISLDNRGVWWSKLCPECGWQEPYKVTIPPRAHPDNPLCLRARADLCQCSLTCEADSSRTPR
jgi:hypothetical protein